MAKFLRVGVHSANECGYTCKAWTVRRIGPAVLVKWGSVEVQGAGHGRRIYWAGQPQQKNIRCGSEKRARRYVKKAIAKRFRHLYEKLPGRVRIRRAMFGSR
jgi:hypothetical protein